MITFERLKKWLEHKTWCELGKLKFELMPGKSAVVDYIVLCDTDGFQTCFGFKLDKAEKLDLGDSKLAVKAEELFVKHFLEKDMFCFAVGQSQRLSQLYKQLFKCSPGIRDIQDCTQSSIELEMAIIGI